MRKREDYDTWAHAYTELIVDRLRALDVSGTIARARVANHQSQAALARRSGLSQSQIAKLETGTNTNPSVATLARVLSALGLKLVIVPDIT